MKMNVLAWYAGGGLMWAMAILILLAMGIGLWRNRRGAWADRLAEHLRYRETAMEILNRSYAKGEFTPEQYETVRHVLER